MATQQDFGLEQVVHYRLAAQGGAWYRGRVTALPTADKPFYTVVCIESDSLLAGIEWEVGLNDLAPFMET